MSSMRYLNTMLTVIAVLLGLNLLTHMGSGGAPMVNTAHAQTGLPNAGAQRKDMIDELKKLNIQVGDLVNLFRSGEAKVKAVSAAKDSD